MDIDKIMKQAEDMEYEKFLKDTGTITLYKTKEKKNTPAAIKDRYFGARMNSNKLNTKVIDHAEKWEEREKQAQKEFDDEFSSIDFDAMKKRMNF